MSKILIVDDAAFMRMMIKDSLKKGGYTDFIEAENGEIALAEYKENRPDLVLLDITMPVMDGVTALRKIRQIDPNAVVVMISAMGQQSFVVDAVQAGAKDFIVKPFEVERLRKVMDSF